MSDDDYCEKCKHALATHLPRGTCRHIETLSDDKTRECGCRDFTVDGESYLVTETPSPPYYEKTRR